MMNYNWWQNDFYMQIKRKGVEMVKLYKDWEKQGLEIIRFNSKLNMLSKIYIYNMQCLTG